MDVMEKVEKTEPVIRDFLIWLWFKSETNDGIIDLGDDGHAEIRFSGKITLETDADEPKESVTCSGDHPRLKEARFALTENKKATKAAMTLILGDDEYAVERITLLKIYRTGTLKKETVSFHIYRL